MAINEEELGAVEKLAFYRLIPVTYVLALMLASIFGYLLERGLIRVIVKVPSFPEALTCTISTIGSLMAITLGFKSLSRKRIVRGRVVEKPLVKTLKLAVTLVVIGGGSAFLSSLAGAITSRGAVREDALVRGITVLLIVSLYLCIWLFLTQLLTLAFKGRAAYLPYLLWFLLTPYGTNMLLPTSTLRELLRNFAVISPTYSLAMAIAPEEVFGVRGPSLLSPEIPIDLYFEYSTFYISILAVEFAATLLIVVLASQIFLRVRYR